MLSRPELGNGYLRAHSMAAVDVTLFDRSAYVSLDRLRQTETRLRGAHSGKYHAFEVVARHGTEILIIAVLTVSMFD